MDDNGRNEEEAPDNATTDDEDDHTDKKNRKRSHNNQDFNEHGESSHDGDSNHCFEISEDNPADEREPWVNHITRATCKTDDLSAAI